MANRLASSATLYTPARPVSHATADAIRSLVSKRLAALTAEVQELLEKDDPALAATDGNEEEIVIITTPPPR